MITTKKDIKKVLLYPTVRSSLCLARDLVWLKRSDYKDQDVYYEALNEVIEDLDSILFLIAQLNLEEEENNKWLL